MSHAGTFLVPRYYVLREQLHRVLKLVATESAESTRDQGELLSA